jgi:hypothetical protein
VLGRCEYDFITGADCDDGNACTVNDTCAAGACTGTPMVCNTPRAPACLDATQLQTYDNPGVCNGGRCVYTQQTITCGSGGCANNACQTDPCANLTCNTPPSVCYGSAGTCSQGSCSYPPNQAACDDGDACTTGDTCGGGVCRGAPKVCNTPDPDTCRDANTAAIHERIGRCAAGTCGYTVRYISCPAGCANGACNPSGWASMTSNSNQSLYGVWGTSASSVWAVGGGGSALYYDGIRWQARPTPQEVQSDTLVSLSGTGDGNVFASGVNFSSTGSGTSIIRFNGTSWSVLGRIALAYRPSCVGAYADNDAFVWGRASAAGGAARDDSGVLYRVTGGVATLVMSTAVPFFSNLERCGIHVFSPTDIVATGQAQVFRIDSVAKTATPIGNAALSSQNGALWAQDTNNLFITLGTNAQQWTGGPSWTNLNTGLNGVLLGLSGTSASRVFAAGWAAGGPTQVGTVLFWDGLGWTVEAIPSGTPRLQGVWASPADGRVFAVGINGAIVTGP